MSALSKAARSVRMHFSLFGLKGVILRALQGLGVGLDSFKAPVPNTSQKIHLRLGTTDVAAFEHVFVQEEYGFELAQEPSIIVDAGANVGLSAAYFSMRYPTATIIAIEPDKTNFKVLAKNAKLFRGIRPINAALWSHEGFVKMSGGEGGHWGLRASETENLSRSTIRSMTLGKLLDELHVDHINLLKVDVEGAECEIFADPSPWINRVDVICAELHDRFRPDCSKIFRSATSDFPLKWQRGELHCVARTGLILKM